MDSAASSGQEVAVKLASLVRAQDACARPRAAERSVEKGDFLQRAPVVV